ncbi:hypothetical protein O0L34_g15902 [Tuta absoluta]|nr:hypothetical protein O0L34_g15902 [Tuta absoluta]
MFSTRIRIAGLVLIVAHCTQSFVLLTANIDDVKKIARKFVPEPMAQQIADFISKAAGQAKDIGRLAEKDASDTHSKNLSMENEQNIETVNKPLDNVGIPKIELSKAARQAMSRRYKKYTRPTVQQSSRETTSPNHYALRENPIVNSDQARHFNPTTMASDVRVRQLVYEPPGVEPAAPKREEKQRVYQREPLKEREPLQKREKSPALQHVPIKDRYTERQVRYSERQEQYPEKQMQDRDRIQEKEREGTRDVVLPVRSLKKLPPRQQQRVNHYTLQPKFEYEKEPLNSPDTPPKPYQDVQKWSAEEPTPVAKKRDPSQKAPSVRSKTFPQKRYPVQYWYQKNQKQPYVQVHYEKPKLNNQQYKSGYQNKKTNKNRLYRIKQTTKGKTIQNRQKAKQYKPPDKEPLDKIMSFKEHPDKSKLKINEKSPQNVAGMEFEEDQDPNFEEETKRTTHKTHVVRDTTGYDDETGIQEIVNVTTEETMPLKEESDKTEHEMEAKASVEADQEIATEANEEMQSETQVVQKFESRANEKEMPSDDQTETTPTTTTKRRRKHNRLRQRFALKSNDETSSPTGFPAFNNVPAKLPTAKRKTDQYETVMKNHPLEETPGSVKDSIKKNGVADVWWSHDTQQNEVSTMVINLVADIQDEPEKPSERATKDNEERYFNII